MRKRTNSYGFVRLARFNTSRTFFGPSRAFFAPSTTFCPPSKSSLRSVRTRHSAQNVSLPPPFAPTKTFWRPAGARRPGRNSVFFPFPPSLPPCLTPSPPLPSFARTRKIRRITHKGGGGEGRGLNREGERKREKRQNCVRGDAPRRGAKKF